MSVRRPPRAKHRSWAVACTLVLLLGVVQVTPAVAQTVLLSDDFEDGAADGWTAYKGTWSVQEDGTHVYRQSNLAKPSRAAAGSTSWTDYAVQARVKPTGWNGLNRYVAILARWQDTNNHYALALRSNNKVVLLKIVAGATTFLASKGQAVALDTWYTLKLEVSGSTIRGYVNGVLKVTATDATFPSGRIGARTQYGTADYDDVLVTGTQPSPPGNGPVGWASVNAWGQNGTTGGAAGPTVTVSTASALIDYMARPGPYVIQVSGMIALTGQMRQVTSDKTIVGLGSSSGITGAGLNIGINVNDTILAPPANAVHNVIIRNLVFRNFPDDAINIQMFSHHIWIDHNDLSAAADGLIDIKRGSNYITISWNHTHDHTKNMLLGHDDANGDQDVGRLKVTYHHNWFDGTPQRNPRVRFGEPVHVYNNYYFGNSDVGVACQAEGGCWVEGNYFENVEEPMTPNYAGPQGRIVERLNTYVNSGPPIVRGTVEDPGLSYAYTLDTASSVKAIVMAGAGVGH